MANSKVGLLCSHAHEHSRGANKYTEQLNMDWLTCNLPAETADQLRAYWSEYWEGITREAQIVKEICVFEHLIALEEDGIGYEDLPRPNLSSPHLRQWIKDVESSEQEIADLKNDASFGFSYWDNPEVNRQLLVEVIKKKSATSPLPYIRMLRDISFMKRRGWVARGIDPVKAESNAAHSWGGE